MTGVAMAWGLIRVWYHTNGLQLQPQGEAQKVEEKRFACESGGTPTHTAQNDPSDVPIILRYVSRKNFF